MQRLCCGLLVLLAGTALGAAERPNIIFLYNDDLAPWALGIAGHPDARTPNLDRLYGEGAYLINAFTVTPVCSPSRCSLVTSRYGREFGITDWIKPGVEADLGLEPGTRTWIADLSDAGYRCGLVGKWHLGTKNQYHPTQFGYHHFMGFRGGGNKPIDPLLEVDGKLTQLQGSLPDILVNDAIQFLRREKGGPFLLSLHFRAPHAPYAPVPEQDARPFADLDPTIPNPDFPKLNIRAVKDRTREYLASVASVDRNVGRLLDELDALGLTRRTIVIHTSDHGYNIGHHGVWHKGNGSWIVTDPPPATPNIPRGQRPNMYDTSLRVPCGIRWPGVIKPGTRITQTVSNLDWYPTLLAMAGVARPKDQTIRGRNFVPLLRGEAVEWDNDLYAEYNTHHQSKTQMRAYRTPEWKLMRDFGNPGRDELYDLKADPDETRNLIDSADPRVQAARDDLNRKLLARMATLGDPTRP